MSKRVLFIDEDPERNGSTVSMEYLVRGFSSRGYDVFVLSWKRDLQAKSALTPYVKLLDAIIWPVPTITMCVHFTYTMSPFSWRGMSTIVKDFIKFLVGVPIVMKAIKDTQADLVYPNESSVVQASVAAWLSGVPAVIHIRSPLLKGAFGFRRRVVSRLILAFNKAVFAVTRREAEQLCPHASERDKIKVIGEFFPEDHVHSVDVNTCRKSFRLPTDKKIVAMLGGIRALKGTLDFLQAAELVSSRYRDVVFVIAGKEYRNGNPERRAYFDECMRLVERLRQRGSIHMLGDIMNSLELIVASDIIVSPSPQAHFSRPVIEAWGFAKPVIAVKTDHILDLITHGVNGLLVDAADHDGLARCLYQLLDDIELCKRLGTEGKKKANADFNAEKNLGMIVDVCDALITA